MDPQLKDVVTKLRMLSSNGKLSPKLKVAVRELITALEKGDMNRADEIAYLHQKISGVVKDEYGEDDDYNKSVAGKTAYQLFDDISHQYYKYRRG